MKSLLWTSFWLAACAAPVTQQPTTQAWRSPVFEDLVPPQRLAPEGDEPLSDRLPDGVARLARVEGVAQSPQQFGEALLFGVDITHTRVVLREGGGMLRELANLEGGKLGDDWLAGPVVAAPDATRVFVPVRRPDGSRAVLGWDMKAPAVHLADGIWPARMPDGSILTQIVGAAARGRAFKHYVEGRNPLDPREDPQPIYAPRDARVVSYPRVSPDGTKVAYVDAPGGLPGTDAPASIALLAIAGGSARTIVPDAMRAGPPSWSADGRWILFSGRPEGATGRDVFAVRAAAATGGEPVRLTDHPGDEDHPIEWRGGLVWVARGHRAIAVAMTEIGGEGEQPAPSLPAYAAAPAVSEDGAVIAFVVPQGTDAGVWVRLTRGAEPRRVFAGAVAPVRPAIHGEGAARSIAFVAPTDRGLDLFVVPESGGTPARLTTDGTVLSDAPLAVSRTGDVAWIADLDRSRTLVTLPISGGERRVVATDVHSFSWAPGGVAVVREVEGRTVLSLLDGDGEADVPAAANASWRPVRVTDDGAAIFVLERLERPRLLRVERERGEVTAVLDLPASSDARRTDVSVDPQGHWAMTFVARTSSEIRARPELAALLPAQ